MTLQLIPAWTDQGLRPVEKLEVHRRGLRHMAVSVFVMDGPRVLLQQRAASKYHSGGLWANTCCTHPRWGEDGAACAVRRLREELGITGLTPESRGTIEYRADVPPDLVEHEVVDIFLAEAGPDLPIRPDPDEVQATRWVDLYELNAQVRRHPSRFTAWLRIYMAEHIDAIFGVANRA